MCVTHLSRLVYVVSQTKTVKVHSLSNSIAKARLGHIKKAVIDYFVILAIHFSHIKYSDVISIQSIYRMC